jgi:hypothetical protein
VADFVYEHKMKADANMLKMKKINKYALEKESYLQYALSCIVILVRIVANLGSS